MRLIHRDRRWDSGSQGLWESLLNATVFLFGMMKKFMSWMVTVAHNVNVLYAT